MAEGTGTGVPESHQEIEDEPSSFDTNFALASQAGGEEGQIATPSTRQSQVGIVNTSLIQTSSSEGGGEIAILNTESQVGIANPNSHQATPSEAAGGEEGQIATPSTHQSKVGIVNTSLFQTTSSDGIPFRMAKTSSGSSSSEEHHTAESESDTETGTGVPGPHQEIEDEPSILDTNFDLTSQADGEEGQIATPSAHQSQVRVVNTSLFQTSSSKGGGEIAIPSTESQVGIANPNTHQATPSEASGEEGQIATHQSQAGIVNTSSIQTTSSEGGEIAIPNTESQVGIANPDTHQATPSEVVVAGGDFKNAYFGPHTSTNHFEGTGEPERHQEIEDELSSLDTNFDLTSQGGREIAIPNTESQVGIANPDTHQAKPSEVVVAGGDFKNAYFGPHISTSHFEERTYVNPTFNYHFHSATNQEASNSASQQLNTRKLQENTELEEGYVRICDDTVMCTRNPIGEGTNVYEGYQEHVSEDGVPTRLPVAIKMIFGCTDKDKKEVAHLVTLARHPNVVTIIRSIEHKTPLGSTLFIVMQLCGLRNLQDYLKENRKNDTPFDFKKTLKFTKQLVKGMKHIHDNGIVHRDVKPENILLSLDETKVMFADFGLGKKLRQGRTSTQVTAQGQGTRGYMAPETLSTEKVSKSGDIFSFGVTIFEVWSNGLNPYGADNISRDFNIMHNKPPNFSGLLLTGFLRNNFLNWIRPMLQHDPRLRPTIDEVLKHIFLLNAKKSDEELLAMSSLNLGARTPSVDESPRKQPDVRPKEKPGFFRKIFGGTARRNVEASSVKVLSQDLKPRLPSAQTCLSSNAHAT